MTPEEIMELKGLRPTKARLAVLSALLKKEGPLSHAEIERELEGKLDRVTLYRALNALKEHGVVHAVCGTDGVWRFCAHDPTRPGCPANHPHFLCLTCGRMFCLIDQPLQRVEVPPGVEVLGKQMLVYGTCRSCLRSRSENEPHHPFEIWEGKK